MIFLIILDHNLDAAMRKDLWSTLIFCKTRLILRRLHIRRVDTLAFSHGLRRASHGETAVYSRL